MNHASLLVVLVAFSIVPVIADTFGAGANQFEINFVTISGDASSANGTNIGGYEVYPYKTFTDPSSFRIGVHEVTYGQWKKFEAEYGPIYDSYDGHWTQANMPMTQVNWYEIAQFVNWLNVSTGHQPAYRFTGIQGTSSYTFGVWDEADAWGGTNVCRHKDAYYFVPDEDEWVKAAYWNGTLLQEFANASEADIIYGLPDHRKWNYGRSYINEPWNVGTGAQELNGTFDMMGNVWEITESLYSAGLYDSFTKRAARGGCCQTSEPYDALDSSYRAGIRPYTENSLYGFRVASIVPEPATLMFVVLGIVALRARRS